MKSFKHFSEATKTIPIGLCFKYAYQQAVTDEKLTLVHGIVQDPYTGKSYPHAWVENGRLVKDWQTMEMGGSKYAKKGWPLKAFYDAFNPTKLTKYKGKIEIGLKAVRSKHYGPW